MNKIKDSFSKIKASDEFKDKLEKELLNTHLNLRTTPSKKIYYKPSMVAASILFIFLGVASMKVIMNSLENKNTNLDNISYNPIENSDNDNLNSDNSPTDTSTDKKDISNIDNNNNNNNNNNSLLVYADKSESPSLERDVPPTEVLSPKSNNTNEEKKESPSISSKDVLDSSSDKSDFSSISSNKLRMDSTDKSPDKEVYIPKVELPNSDIRSITKMIPVIVYKGRLYTKSSIELDSENAKDLIGKKLGTTNPKINELSSQSQASINFASNIVPADIYAVNGYDEDFRIMTNIILDNGTSYPEFYDCLNGISLKTGGDFFGKLKLQNNIASAKFQTFNDWNTGTGVFYSINDFNLLNSLIDSLNSSTPFLPESVEPLLGNYLNNENCKKITIDLKDGCRNLTFTVLKNGYIYYDSPEVYFKINNAIAEQIWDKLSVASIN